MNIQTMNTQAGFISRMLTLIMLAVVFVGGLLFARHAHEGEALYPLRILGEEIEYALIPSEEGKIRLRLDQLNDLDFDIRKLTETGEYAQVEKQSQKFAEKTQELKSRIDNLNQTGKDTTDLEQGLKAVEQGQLCTQSQIK